MDKFPKNTKKNRGGTKVIWPFLIIFLIVAQGTAYADEGQESCWPAWFPRLLGVQFTGIYQRMPDFNSPYIGDNSLRFDQGKGQSFTQTYGIYLGSRISQSLQIYLDVEMFKGSGISDGLGLGGYMNGDFIRAGAMGLGQDPLPGPFLCPLSYPTLFTINRAPGAGHGPATGS